MNVAVIIAVPFKVRRTCSEVGTGAFIQGSLGYFILNKLVCKINLMWASFRSVFDLRFFPWFVYATKALKPLVEMPFACDAKISTVL